jgi:L-alanine-DL-glutamate epimerase-like enolase superfamily enzyme
MEIKVNDVQWQGFSQEERDNITQIVTGHFKGASIVPHSETPAIDLGQMTTAGFLGLSNPFCKAACDIAQAAAVAACSTVGGPIAVAACIAVAQAAGDACRSKC